jgi:creatinine amidohydrolase/Fe(II)-dependent formamide hydrolase-like protein
MSVFFPYNQFHTQSPRVLYRDRVKGSPPPGVDKGKSVWESSRFHGVKGEANDVKHRGAKDQHGARAFHVDTIQSEEADALRVLLADMEGMTEQEAQRKPRSAESTGSNVTSARRESAGEDEGLLGKAVKAVAKLKFW